MPIRARLRGDSIDLGILAELFPTPNDPSVSTDSEGYYLMSASLDDDVTGDAGAMYGQASVLLRAVNGVARQMRSGFRPVELNGHFSDPVGHAYAVVLTDTLQLRDHIPEPVQPDPPAARFVQLAAKYTEVREVLDLLAKPATALDPSDLYKIYEIICVHVTGSPRCSQQALTATGWVTSADLNAFTAWANHPGASGVAARHARQSGPAPKYTMTIEEARQMIRALVSRWLRSL
jgi:hypothetical protein